MAIGYNKIKVPDNSYKFSPSGLVNFYRDPKEWLNTFKGRSNFKGNKATVMGTLVHYIFESHFDKRDEKQYFEDAQKYLDTEVDEEVINIMEANEIMDFIKRNYDTVNSWIDNDDNATVLESEPEVKHCLQGLGEFANDYYIAGSVDAVVVYEETGEKLIRDYKTSNRKISSITNYKMQLLLYAMAYNKENPNSPVTGVEVVGIRELKKGLQIDAIRYYFTDTDMKSLYKILEEVSLVHQTALKYPQIESLLFRQGVNFQGQFIF